MSHLDKVEFIGKLVHACQTDNELMEMGLDIVNEAERRGLYNRVSILPESFTISDLKQTKTTTFSIENRIIGDNNGESKI